jgi:hypothetical protein
MTFARALGALLLFGFAAPAHAWEGLGAGYEYRFLNADISADATNSLSGEWGAHRVSGVMHGVTIYDRSGILLAILGTAANADTSRREAARGGASTYSYSVDAPIPGPLVRLSVLRSGDAARTDGQEGTISPDALELGVSREFEPFEELPITLTADCLFAWRGFKTKTARDVYDITALSIFNLGLALNVRLPAQFFVTVGARLDPIIQPIVGLVFGYPLLDGSLFARAGFEHRLGTSGQAFLYGEVMHQASSVLDRRVSLSTASVVAGFVLPDD